MAYFNAIRDFRKAAFRTLLTWPKPYCKWRVTVRATSHQTLAITTVQSVRDSCGKYLCGNAYDET